MDRREWMRRGSALGALSLLGSTSIISTLTAEEKAKFNPRDLDFPLQLQFNENPFGPSAKVREAMVNAFDIGCRYPDPYAKELLDMIAEKEGVSRDHIVITGGSSEGLRITGLTFANNGGEIIAARPTFLAMMTYAQQWGATVNWVDLDDQLTHDVDEMYKRISSKTELIFLCNPNNPTSTLLSKEKLVSFCTEASKKTIVFSDEAYYDFIEEKNYPSMVSLVKEGKDVIVSRTFSKVYGLAGLRIGYLLAKPALAKKIRDNVVAYTNVIALKAAVSSMKDDEFYRFSLEKVKECKQIMYAAMDELKLEYIKSNTNFIFFKTGRNINTFNKQMLDEGVRVGRAFPPYTDWCRISTGTIEEVQYFAEKLKKVLA